LVPKLFFTRLDELEETEKTTWWQSPRFSALTIALVKCRRAFVIVAHMGLIAAANYVAFWLRFDGDIPSADLTLWHGLLPTLLLIRVSAFLVFRLHEGLWRYASLWDLKNIILGVLTSTLGFYSITHYVMGITAYPRSIFIVDSILLVILLGGVRITRRMVREFNRADQEKRVLIFGAGDAGEMIRC
jgi:FlaA1/EpsC-like NDP-sugar epimerase